MKFKSKPEAYSYALLTLYELKNRYPTVEIENVIEKIKVAFENHEQKPEVVTEYIKPLLTFLNAEDQTQLTQLIKDIQESDYKQENTEKFQNILGRRSESELPILLLTNPTKEIMKTVGRVSEEILKAIEDLEKTNSYSINSFTSSLTDYAHVISCGAFTSRPSLTEVKDILKSNNPSKLAEIMHIHFKFAQTTSREVPIRTAPVRPPVGKMREIIKEIWTGSLEDFFKSAISQEYGGRRYRSYITDEKMYESKLYTIERGRGRLGSLARTFTNQLGLMLTGQKEYAVNYPSLKARWVADCQGQSPDYYSAYVKDLIENDAIYVAGPSGMTSLFLGQMEFLANFETIELKQLYLSAVVSYIVGAGFHSIHEVIGPAEYALNLVPGYNVTVPTREKLAEPPKFNTFFQLQSSLDPEFAAKRQQAWDKYIDFFNKVYAPKNIKDFKEINITTLAASPKAETKEEATVTTGKEGAPTTPQPGKDKPIPVELPAVVAGSPAVEAPKEVASFSSKTPIEDKAETQIETPKEVASPSPIALPEEKSEIKAEIPQTVTAIVASAIAAAYANPETKEAVLENKELLNSKELINERIDSFLTSHGKSPGGLNFFKYILGNTLLEDKEIDLINELKANLKTANNFPTLIKAIDDCKTEYADMVRQLGLSHFAQRRECFQKCINYIDEIIKPYNEKYNIPKTNI